MKKSPTKSLMKLILLNTFIALFMAMQSINCFAQTIAMAGGSAFSLFLCNNNQPMSCGINGFGQLGNGTTADSWLPSSVITLSAITAIAAGESHALFLKSDSTVWGCGFNAQGQLSNGTTTTTYANPPVQVNAPNSVIAIASGSRHCLFLKTNGTVWACGENSDGCLGDGTNITTYASNPVQVIINSVSRIACGNYHSLFLKTDSTVWACGANYDGQLGNGTTVTNNTPTQVSALTQVTAMSAGLFHSLFLRTDSTVWACGYNAKGQLGDGTNMQRNTPVQLTSLSGIIDIAAGREHSLFLKSDGTVWACGDNFTGQLGQGTTANSNIPVQVNLISDIKTIAAGDFHSLFFKSDSIVWACGNNGNGQLGDGTTVQRNTPVQVSNLCGVTGIEDRNSENDFILYPNPGTGTFYIKSFAAPNTLSLQITTALGITIYDAQLHSTLTTIDLKKQSKGVYFYQLKEKNNVIKNGKFIIE